MELAKRRISSKIMSFLSLKFQCENYIFPIQSISFTFVSLKSTGFKFFAKIMGKNYVFCSSQISFKATNIF